MPNAPVYDICASILRNWKAASLSFSVLKESAPEDASSRDAAISNPEHVATEGRYQYSQHGDYGISYCHVHSLHNHASKTFTGLRKIPIAPTNT